MDMFTCRYICAYVDATLIDVYIRHVDGHAHTHVEWICGVHIAYMCMQWYGHLYYVVCAYVQACV